MEMYQIRYFLALSETLNFTKAAERCNVAQPSLTRAIRSLEVELGGELLRRERTLSHLTELGERMAPLMRQCYEAAVAAKAVARSLKKGEATPLSVAVSQSISVATLTRMLSELSRAFTGLHLNLLRGSGPEIVACLKSGEAELAIAGPLGETWERLDAVALYDEPIDLFVSGQHRLAARKAAEFKDLASETLLINAASEMAGKIADRLKDTAAGTARSHRVASLDDLLTLIKANLGVAIIPLGIGSSAGLSLVPLGGLDLVRTVSVYSVAGRCRGTACATLFNMLRAADWGFESATGHKWEGTDGRTRAQRHPRRDFRPLPRPGGPAGRPVAGLRK
jgi:DNA-binding transcriptional LysR family regulator